MAPPRGHMFYIGLYSEKPEKIFLSETIRHRVLIFGMKHHLLDIYQVCSNMPLGPKMAPPQGRMFYIDLYSEKPEKILTETIRPRVLIFGK